MELTKLEEITNALQQRLTATRETLDYFDKFHNAATDLSAEEIGMNRGYCQGLLEEIGFIERLVSFACNTKG
jgi:hypothetical protein